MHEKAGKKERSFTRSPARLSYLVRSSSLSFFKKVVSWPVVQLPEPCESTQQHPVEMLLWKHCAVLSQTYPN